MDETQAADGMATGDVRKKPSLLLIAYRAFGDWLYTVPVLPYLFERYEVFLETNQKCFQFVHNDPRFKRISVFRFEKYKQECWKELFAARWKKLEEELKPDRVLNLNGTLEVTCVSERFQKEFYLPVAERRSIFGHHGFYESVFRRAEIPIPKRIDLGGMYFSEEEEKHCQEWMKKRGGGFNLLIPIAGSTAQKVFHNFKEVVDEVLARYTDTHVFLAGDDPCSDLVPEHPRIFNVCGNRVSIKQAAHLTKYMDMVVGPETFLLVAAGMWGTPKVVLATTSSVYQMTQYHTNDYSIQAPLPCSPCHKSIYYDDDCESPILNEDGSFKTTACSLMFPKEEILKRVDYVYRLKQEKK